MGREEEGVFRGDCQWDPEWRRYGEVCNPICLRENELIRVPQHLPEMEVQARWFSGEFGTEFVTEGGDKLKVLQLGVWNREAGPDFAEACISINGGEPQRGCIELDREVRDWERHGHSTNPDYESVVLHLFWQHPGSERQARAHFTRTAANRFVPQVCLDLEHQESEMGKRSLVPPGLGIGLEPVAKPGRCFPVLSGLSEDKAREILDASSRFRFARKAARLARIADIHGPDEALYQALAVSLGYKANKLPFALLSQRLPLRLLHKNKDQADALLFGAAGFIDSTDLSLFDSEARSYLRALWGKWWARRIEFQRFALDGSQWRFNGLRPANDPHRRVAALIQLASRWGEVRALARRCRVAAIRKFFSSLCDEFWDYRYSFHSVKQSKPIALVGDSRVNEMLANVFFPFAVGMQRSAGLGGRAEALWKEFKRLPADLSNRRVGIAAIRLFGENPMGELFQRRVIYQQGLLQIYEDFCAQDGSDCHCCPFPEQCLKLPEQE